MQLGRNISLWKRALSQARFVVAALSARFMPGRQTQDVLAQMDGAHPRVQLLWTGGVLVVLFLACLFAASLGPYALAGLFGVIVLLIR
ncbi:hypothetical protein [Primorskyibacter sp. S187A]|uniref:hypothetical protein n=1 Tax=Primorskyibacter sp. S187A TaxID=3415130 RepID=UPI003C7CAACB